MRLALLPLIVLASTAAWGELGPQDVEKVLLRDFKPRGQATMDRVLQDGLQRLCTESENNPPAAVAKALEADQMKSIAFPAGSLVGDWQRGEKIAQGGRGMTWSDRPDAPADGSCYNCHQLSPVELSHGTLGPSLLGFGKTRGNSAETQRYVYGKIFNAKAYNLCSQMPRLGHSGTLTPEQIRDLVGLLLDPASPVNR
ncbi:MAG: L-cysteine S-thiosulfotransferase [Betaproteobacteria bacterium]|jgi:sulfur-oxidizing protein SoxX|nr:L-cysteine S-thiosulfotransferase [Betaproteobacteria bacterium]